MSDAPPRTLPANAWTPAFEDIERTLSLTTGFSLLPVQVAHTEVASLLAGWFRARGRRVAWVEPDGPEAWRTLRETLLAFDPDAIDRVMVIGAEGGDGVATGLRRFNVARDLVRERLRCPLLWCGPLPFLEATWTNAPDFWSIRELTVRLLTPLGELAPTRVSEVNRAFAEEKQRVLEALWAVLVRGGYVRELAPLGAYLRLIFAIGFAMAGAEARGRDVMEPLDAEESAHEVPNRILYKLYRARYAHVLTQGDTEAWKAEVDSLLSTVKEPRVKDRVEWLYTRSEFLRTHVPDPGEALLKPWIERTLAEIETSPSSAPALITRVLDDPEVFAYEMSVSVKRSLRTVLRTSNETILEDTLRAITKRLTRVYLPGARGSDRPVRARRRDAQRPRHGRPPTRRTRHPRYRALPKRALASRPFQRRDTRPRRASKARRGRLRAATPHGSGVRRTAWAARRDQGPRGPRGRLPHHGRAGTR